MYTTIMICHFLKIKCELLYVIERLCDFFTLRSYDLIPTLTNALVDYLYPCLSIESTFKSVSCIKRVGRKLSKRIFLWNAFYVQIIAQNTQYTQYTYCRYIIIKMAKNLFLVNRYSKKASPPTLYLNQFIFYPFLKLFILTNHSLHTVGVVSL